MGQFKNEEIEAAKPEIKQVYGILNEKKEIRPDGTVLLTGEVYGHPLFKEGERVTFASDSITEWTHEDARYYETAEGVTYKTFKL